MGDYVCENCFADPYLKQVVQDNALEDDSLCDFCPHEGNVAPLSDVVEVVENALMYHYNDAADELPYDGREGGYQGETFDAFDLLERIEFYEALAEDREGLFDEIARSLPDYAWTDRDYASFREIERLNYSWDRLTKYIKHERRFFFLREDPTPEDDYIPDPLFSPSQTLRGIAKDCVRFNLLKTVPADTVFYRSRDQKEGECFSKPRELSAPPAERAKQNRMSPVGVPMTYVTEDPATALIEIMPPGRLRRRTYALASLRVQRSVTIIDLASILEVPSFFDVDRAEERDHIRFFRSFQSQISHEAPPILWTTKLARECAGSGPWRRKSRNESGERSRQSSRRRRSSFVRSGTAASSKSQPTWI